VFKKFDTDTQAHINAIVRDASNSFKKLVVANLASVTKIPQLCTIDLVDDGPFLKLMRQTNKQQFIDFKFFVKTHCRNMTEEAQRVTDKMVDTSVVLTCPTDTTYGLLVCTFCGELARVFKEPYVRTVRCRLPESASSDPPVTLSIRLSASSIPRLEIKDALTNHVVLDQGVVEFAKTYFLGRIDESAIVPHRTKPINRITMTAIVVAFLWASEWKLEEDKREYHDYRLPMTEFVKNFLNWEACKDVTHLWSYIVEVCAIFFQLLSFRRISGSIALSSGSPGIGRQMLFDDKFGKNFWTFACVIANVSCSDYGESSETYLAKVGEASKELQRDLNFLKRMAETTNFDMSFGIAQEFVHTDDLNEKKALLNTVFTSSPYGNPPEM
jgi:hypothetical protein